MAGKTPAIVWWRWMLAPGCVRGKIRGSPAQG